jgi:DNA-binding NtrC family response regulator
VFKGMDASSTKTIGATQDLLLRIRAVRLRVVAGPDAGLECRVVTPNFSIGTGESADLRLKDPSVSREHLRLTLGLQGVHLRDSSKNGTRIGSLRIHEAQLAQDAILSLGGTNIQFHLESEQVLLPLSQRAAFGDAVGIAPVTRHLFAVLEQAAGSDMTLLMEGESGVGKDVLARAVHQNSARKEHPFVVFDCGAVSPQLIESELFGHERGAFTGATETRRGVLEEAHGGTLFLDELGELPLDLQPKLLRALEAREFRPVGARNTKKFDARVIAATNRKLAEQVARGEFREDLFYRLAVVRVAVPALRDRKEDIELIATHFYRRMKHDSHAVLPPDFVSMIREYSWPGNVRELRNVVEIYSVMGQVPNHADFAMSPRRSANVPEAAPDMGATPGDDVMNLPYHEARKVVLDRFESRYLPAVLSRAGGVMSRAAELAQVARPSFYRMMERLNIRGGKE